VNEHDAAAARAAREAQAYGDDRITEASERWQVRFGHIPFGPTTLRAWDTFFGLARETVGRGGRALDVGCGPGYYTHRIAEQGSAYVLGIDVSEHSIAQAREAYEQPGRIEFRVMSAHERLDEAFDLVCGFAVLHHIDFRAYLLDAYERNLLPGGRMLFWEPCAHPFILAFHALVRSAHTPDEWPLMPRDIAWLRATFPRVRVQPVNVASMATNLASSLLYSDADNPLSRLGDRVDRGLERRRGVQARGQMGIICIDKPAAD
jgi:SAM-dependent methyltransferase